MYILTKLEGPNSSVFWQNWPASDLERVQTTNGGSYSIFSRQISATRIVELSALMRRHRLKYLIWMNKCVSLSWLYDDNYCDRICASKVRNINRNGKRRPWQCTPSTMLYAAARRNAGNLHLMQNPMNSPHLRKKLSVLCVRRSISSLIQ